MVTQQLGNLCTSVPVSVYLLFSPNGLPKDEEPYGSRVVLLPRTDKALLPDANHKFEAPQGMHVAMPMEKNAPADTYEE